MNCVVVDTSDFNIIILSSSTLKSVVLPLTLFVWADDEAISYKILAIPLLQLYTTLSMANYGGQSKGCHINMV